jgi:uncharacterized protein involved in outer membrane biogenesis
MQAKQQAELDEDARIRAEQEKKAREIADILRTKVEPDAEEGAATPAKRRPKRRGNLAKNALVGLAALFVIGVLLLHVIPLRGFANKLEKGIGGWLHEDVVSISNLKFTLIPSPHLKIENLAIGKLLDVKAPVGRVYLDIGALLSDRVVINSLEFDSLTIAGDATKRILAWGNLEGKSAAAEIDLIRLKEVKLDVKPDVKPFSATLSFGKDGKFKQAQLSGEGKWNATVRPQGADYEVDFGARNWQLPIGVPIPISEVRAKGVINMAGLTVSEFEADAMEGKVNGTLQVAFGPTVKVVSDLSIARVKADQFMPAFTKDIAVTGKLEGNFSITAESPTVAALFAAPRVQGKFRLADGSVSNADLVAAMQSPDAAGRAGVTKFAELTGEVVATDGRLSYRSLNLLGGVLRGGGNIDIGANGALGGRLTVEIRSNVAQDRGAFAVTGTVAKPILRRGG